MNNKPATTRKSIRAVKRPATFIFPFPISIFRFQFPFHFHFLLFHMPALQSCRLMGLDSCLLPSPHTVPSPRGTRCLAQYLPCACAIQGTRHVELTGVNNKCQMTAIFCGTLTGDFLPLQLIYHGKT